MQRVQHVAEILGEPTYMVHNVNHNQESDSKVQFTEKPLLHGLSVLLIDARKSISAAWTRGIIVGTIVASVKQGAI